MNWIDLLDWLAAPTEKEKGEVWKRCHPNIHYSTYTNCPDIKRFWDSPIGRLYKDYWAIHYFFISLGRRLDVLEWRIDWEWRLFMNRTRSQTPQALQPRTLNAVCPYCEDDRFFIEPEGNSCYSCGALVYGYQLLDKPRPQFSKNGNGKGYHNNGSTEYREIIEYTEF